MRRTLLSLLILTALVVSVAPVGAQGSGGATSVGGDEAEAREDARERRAEVEAELELLERSDLELQAEADRLDAEIAAAAERADAAEQELAALRQELDALRGQVTEAERRAADAHDALVERAVAAYVSPAPEVGTALLTDGDLQAVGRRQVLLSAVADHDHAVLEESVAAEAALRGAQEAATQAEGRAAEIQATLAADEERLRAARAEQAAVQAVLEDRIEHFQQEADALAAEEAQLTSLIATQQAAARAAATSTTTTAAPTTTTTAGGGGTVPSTTTTSRPSTTTTTQAPSGSLRWPTPGPVTSPYGPRWGRMHQGIDIGAPIGQAIVAADGGYVFFAGEYGGYGNLILLDHFNGTVTAYAHQSSFAVAEGSSVSRGQTIGYVGSTGSSTGPHLHFEVRVWGTAVDPMPYLS